MDLGDLEFHAKSDIPSMWEELAGDFPQMQVPLEIYTDGAWERKRGTLDDVFMYGSDAHIEGSVGIVITAAGQHWRSIGVHCIRITDGALIASLSVFPLELLASVMAIKIAACLLCPVKFSRTVRASKKSSRNPRCCGPLVQRRTSFSYNWSYRRV